MRNPSSSTPGSRPVTAVAAVTFVVSAVVVAAGFLGLISNQAEFLAFAALPVLALCLAAQGWAADRSRRGGVPGLVLLCLIVATAGVVLRASPEHWWGLHLDAIVHRSLFTSLAAVLLGTAAMCLSLFQYTGGGPTSEDVARYPVVLIPVACVLGIYAALIFFLLSRGLPNLSWELITTPYQWLQWDEMVYKDGWPEWVSHSIRQVGLLNQMWGTLLLMGLTSLFALPFGVGVGVLLGEYAEGWFASAVRYSVTILRAMSVFILGLTAVSIVTLAADTPLSHLLSGFYYDVAGGSHVGHGSYITASLVLALLVIPVIARSTEEACRSLPHDLREGSLALGATEGHTLTRIILPWSLPNIITAVLLGCAEAAGSVAVILFIARMGQYGVSPLNEVTSLSFFIFDARYGTEAVADAIRPYQFSAGVLLLAITMGLSAVALALRHHFSWRYRTR
jgi:ABC-type phosphate transport system permease subunit